MYFASCYTKFFVTSLGPTASMSSTCTPMSNVQLGVPKKNKDRAHFERHRVLSTCSTSVPASVLEMFESKTQHGLARTIHTTRLPSIRIFGFQPSGGCAYSCSPSRTSALRKACVYGVSHKSFVSLITFVETPCQENTGALYCCCCRKATFVTVRFFVTSRSVLRSPHCWSFHRVHLGTRHDVCSSRPLVLAHLFEDFHALQEIELFLTSLLLGRHCHVLVGLEETFSVRKSVRSTDLLRGFCDSTTSPSALGPWESVLAL